MTGWLHEHRWSSSLKTTGEGAETGFEPGPPGPGFAPPPALSPHTAWVPRQRGTTMHLVMPSQEPQDRGCYQEGRESLLFVERGW